MITTKYGELPARSLKNYMRSLIDKTYKILPMKEENSPTLKSYLQSYLVELIGCQELILLLSDEPQFMSIIMTITYLANDDYDVAKCKKEVFKCIHTLGVISKKYFDCEV